MEASQNEFAYGAVDISEDNLGVGSYGKVCKAKCGQLPCAVKLLHDNMLDTSSKFVEQFEQECRFLRMIKHPNIVQFLGTVRDPRSRRLALLMELMDESLTRFLERSTGPLPYYTQLNICHDVALALAYLHSNNIIHRDLSSNNVLLIGEGSRAKVTDFGMSKLIGMNPRMTPLTMCPGTQAYMPPEALINPPQYSNKLDCFSHGVLTIQIVSRKIPNPGDAHVYDPQDGLLRQIPETDRRRRDLDLVDPNHPLLPLSLQCLGEREAVRPSADELSGSLATLKGEQVYTRSVEQSRERSMSVQTLQQQIVEKDGELARARANHEIELRECHATFQRQKESELARTRANHETELRECCATFQQQLQERDGKLARITANCQQQIQEKENELARARANHETELRECHKKIERQNILISDCQAKIDAYEQLIDQLRSRKDDELGPLPVNPPNEEPLKCKLSWRSGAPAPNHIESSKGAAVCHGNIAYFSRGKNLYSYSIADNRWANPISCQYEDFSMAIVNGSLTTLGGCLGITATNALLSLCEGSLKAGLPLMQTGRIRPAAVTTPTHLIVAGGRSRYNAVVNDIIGTIELLNLTANSWSYACGISPDVLGPVLNMTLCNGYLYLSQHEAIICCSLGGLLRSCSSQLSVWTRLTNIPEPSGASLATLRGHVLAIGGRGKYAAPSKRVYIYNSIAKNWKLFGELPTARQDCLVAVLPSDELVVVGGRSKRHDGEFISECLQTEIASLDSKPEVDPRTRHMSI